MRTSGLRAGGAEFPIEISFGEARIGERRAFIGYLRDISEREQALEALEDAERLKDSILTAVGEAIVGVDATGVTIFANPAASEMLGYSVPEMTGRNMHDLVHHKHADGRPYLSSECPILGALRRGQRHHGSDELFWRKDGSPLPVDLVSTPIVEQGRVAGGVVAFRDVSGSRRLEQQLRQAQKLEAVGQLAGGIAHDFNNLLTVILAHARFLLEAVQPASSAYEDVQAIREAGERAAKLTTQLLAYSRRQVLVPEEVDLGDVVARLEPMLHRLIGEHIVFVAATRTRDDQVLADRGQLEQVITNLVINARDAMPAGGTLTIEVETPSADALPELLSPGDYVLLRVADTGMGMDEETKARVFEPFFTTKELGAGTGLGLATVFGIVTQSGGQVFVESARGRGTSMNVYLPHYRSPAERHDTRSSPASGLARPAVALATPATVLLVEDEATVRSAVRRILERSGYEVLEARHGADALLVAGQHARTIDLLLTDVVMPELNGVELAEWFERAHPAARIVFMSGYTDDDLFRRGLSNRAVAFVSKPFTASDLLATVRTTLAGD
jgi:PAS domain S-box-containing protein